MTQTPQQRHEANYAQSEGTLESEIQDAKFRVLLAESALAKARAAVVSAEVDFKCAILRLEKLSSHE